MKRRFFLQVGEENSTFFKKGRLASFERGNDKIFENEFEEECQSDVAELDFQPKKENRCNNCSYSSECDNDLSVCRLVFDKSGIHLSTPQQQADRLTNHILIEQCNLEVESLNRKRLQRAFMSSTNGSSTILMIPPRHQFQDTHPSNSHLPMWTSEEQEIESNNCDYITDEALLPAVDEIDGTLPWRTGSFKRYKASPMPGIGDLMNETDEEASLFPICSTGSTGSLNKVASEENGSDCESGGDFGLKRRKMQAVSLNSGHIHQEKSLIIFPKFSVAELELDSALRAHSCGWNVETISSVDNIASPFTHGIDNDSTTTTSKSNVWGVRSSRFGGDCTGRMSFNSSTNVGTNSYCNNPDNSLVECQLLGDSPCVSPLTLSKETYGSYVACDPHQLSVNYW